jgi:hypothetical protein
MIHLTRSRLPEIVIFGPGQRFVTPLALSAGNEIMVRSAGGDEITVSKFSVQEGDQKRTVSTRVDDVIRAIVELGGTYPDVVQALQEAKTTAVLPTRLAIDALPEAGRTYDRLVEDEPESGDEPKDPEDKDKKEQEAKAIPARPTPELYADRGGANSHIDGDGGPHHDKQPDEDDDSNGKANTKKGFFARMLGQ